MAMMITSYLSAIAFLLNTGKKSITRSISSSLRAVRCSERGRQE